jgi:hypothetical protein
MKRVRKSCLNSFSCFPAFLIPNSEFNRLKLSKVSYPPRLDT